jgi:hypothetical protein
MPYCSVAGRRAEMSMAIAMAVQNKGGAESPLEKFQKSGEKKRMRRGLVKI